MVWRRGAGTRLLVAPCLQGVSGIRHGFFTRSGIGENPGRNRDCAIEQAEGPLPPRRGFLAGEREAWSASAQALGFDPAHLVTLGQEHTDKIFVLGGGEARRERGPEGHDALITTRSGQGLGILTADCAPVLLASDSGEIVAAAHAGWRGTAAGILEKVVEALEVLGAPPGRLHAAIGPCVLPCCYPVGEEVIEAITRAARERASEVCRRRGEDGRWSIDLSTANRVALEKAGLTPSNISEARLCTSCRSDLLFSYRQSGAGAGRQISIIVRHASR